jgi:hypothetical protein
MIVSSEKLFSEIMQTISKWSSKGEKVLSTGVRLVCPTPHVAPEAWLHVVFPPLAPEKIAETEKKLAAALPEDFKKFLLQANGLALFSYQLDVFGVRETWVRTGDVAWQPFDLVDHNYETERPAGSPAEVIFFGGVESSDWCFFEFHEGKYRVGKTSREIFRPSAYWKDFASWLLSEISALEKRFDSDGVCQI